MDSSAISIVSDVRGLPQSVDGMSGILDKLFLELIQPIRIQALYSV